MEVVEIVKKEIKSFKKNELFLFFLVIFTTVIISVFSKDSKIALINAICGMSYTFFAGYGKVYCFLIGLIGTFCYCYLSYKNGFFGNLLLYGLYYFPMQVLGIFKWKKNLKKDKNEIIKTKLSKKERIIYLFFGVLLSCLFYFVLKYVGDKNPFMDSFSTIFSIIGMLLTVKRCIEQWYVWFFVNLTSFLMWLYAVINGTNCISTVVMWGVYLFLAVYFLKMWKKELKKD